MKVRFEARCCEAGTLGAHAGRRVEFPTRRLHWWPTSSTVEIDAGPSPHANRERCGMTLSSLPGQPVVASASAPTTVAALELAPACAGGALARARTRDASGGDVAGVARAIVCGRRRGGAPTPLQAPPLAPRTREADHA
jgi:hypothetical protein